MPKSPRKYAQVMEALIKYASPNKKTALEQQGIRKSKDTVVLISPDLKKRLAKQGKTRKGRAMRRVYAKTLLGSYSSIRQASIHLGVRWHFLSKVSRLSFENIDQEKPNTCGLPSDTVKTVKDFFESPVISVTLGGMKHTNKRGETVRFLTETVNTIYAKFIKETNVKISKSKFAKLRPTHVRPKHRIPKNECICIVCTNVELLKKKIQMECRTKTLGDKEELCAATLCPTDAEYGSLNCIERMCKNCGVDNLDIPLQDPNKSIQFYR